MTLLKLKEKFLKELKGTYPINEIESFFYLVLKEKLNIQRVDFALNPNLIATNKFLSYYNEAIEKLKKQIPIQYILGNTIFFGLEFKVNQHVLIPRPETEELVELIINDYHSKNINEKIKILDIGSGSGCIAITLAKKIPNSEVWAIDISIEAINLAKENALNNNVDIKFIQKDILKSLNLPSNFDIIVSNPPYVRKKEKLSMKPNVLEFEPHLALFVEDNNPLLFYEKIAELAKLNLKKEGILYFEINQYLGNETKNLLKTNGFSTVELFKDIFDNDRILKAKINK